MIYKNCLNLIILLFINLIILSCSTIGSNYLLSKDKEIIKLEKQDHNFCADLKLEPNSNNNSQSKLYWRCRLSMSKYKIRPNARFGQDVKFNLQINELISQISVKIADSDEAPVTRVSKKLDSIDHKKCLAMGFTTETKDEAKINDYFSCRKALIEDYQTIPPFFNSSYLKYPSRSYSLGFAIDAKIDREIKNYKEAEEKYPTCIKFYAEKNNFKECTIAQEESKICLAEIDKKRFKKEAEEKIFCQKESYLQFPDEFLKEDNQIKKDLQKTNKNSDYYNQYNFVSIGIDDISKFSSEPSNSKKPKKEENKNSKAGLYNKNELNKLRQDYITKCQAEIDGIIKEYNKSLEKSCADISEYKEIEL